MADNKRLDFLQIFRGLAALLVLFHHTDDILSNHHNYHYFGGIFEPGWSGVDFFFVLSGFIIYYIHYKDIGKPNAFKPFIQKRFIRVYPMTWLVVIPIIPMFFLFPGFGDPGVQTNPWVILKQLFLFPQERVVLDVSWTLSHEILFYLLFGLLIISGRTIVKTVIGIWILLTLLSMVNIINFESWGLNFLISPFHIEFVFGCIAAYVYLNYNLKKSSMYILVFGVLLFISTWVLRLLEILPKYQVESILLFGTSSFFIVLGSVYISINKTNWSKIFLFIGDASFSIYLTHFPAISLLNKMFATLGLYEKLGYFLATSIIIAITLIIGCIAYQLIEKQLLKVLRNKMIGNKPIIGNQTAV